MSPTRLARLPKSKPREPTPSSTRNRLAPMFWRQCAYPLVNLALAPAWAGVVIHGMD